MLSHGGKRVDIVYTGDFVEDWKHGYGVQRYPDGTTHNGIFERNKLSYGVVRDPRGRILNSVFRVGEEIHIVRLLPWYRGIKGLNT